MAKLVGAISMSHAPGASGWPDTPPEDMKKRLAGIHGKVKAYLADSRPDVIIAILDDHFENQFRNLMPTFSIAIADTHSGPPEHMLKPLGYTEKKIIGGAPELAAYLHGGLVGADFDVARMGEIEYGNNLMTPLWLIRPDADIPVVPVFTNVFTPPLASMDRCYRIGETLRRLIEQYPGKERVVLLATGGLSHWPPFWSEDSPEDDEFLQRMKRFQTEGKPVLAEDPDIWEDLGKYELEMAAKNQFPLNSNHPLVNPEWDQGIMDAFAAGDTDRIRNLSSEEIQEKGGHGGQEVRTWAVVMGAMNGAPATYVGYEAVNEFICGMGYLTYPV